MFFRFKSRAVTQVRQTQYSPEEEAFFESITNANRALKKKLYSSLSTDQKKRYQSYLNDCEAATEKEDLFPVPKRKVGTKS